MEDKELEAPVRVRLVIADRLLTKDQRSQGLSRSWAAIRPQLATVADFARDIINRLSLKCRSIHRLVLSMDGFTFPSFVSTSVFMDNDTIRVERKICKARKTSAVISDKECQIEGNKIIDKQTVLSDNGILLTENGENASQKKKNNSCNNKKRVLTEVTSTKRKCKQVKGTKRKHIRVEGPEKSRNKEVTCTSEDTSSELQCGQEFHGGDVISKEQKSIMLQYFKDEFINTNKTTAGSHPWSHGNNLDDPDAQNLKNMRKSWSPSDGLNERNSQLRISNHVSTDEVEESDKEDDIDFESLYPLTCLPTEGDIIAYRLVETSSGRPELSVFQVGKVLKFDPITMLVLLGPVPKYPIFPDGEIPESQKSMYKEDGTLEIDFGSLVDLRLVEESESGKGYSKPNVFTWENGTGSHSGFNNNMNSSWKAAETSKTDWGTWTPNISREPPSWQSMGQRGSRIQSHRGSRGRNAGGMRKNVNSPWQAGEVSNANEALECCRSNRGPNNSRYGISKPYRGQIGNRFGLHGSFSRGMNNRAGNNDNSAWEANSEVTNANEPTQTQENGWDTWTPNTSRAGASWSHEGQYSSGFRSGGGFSRVTRRGRGRGGRHSNTKFRQ